MRSWTQVALFLCFLHTPSYGAIPCIWWLPDCPKISNGFSRCSADKGSCEMICLQPYYTDKGETGCYYYDTDPDNCEGPGIACVAPTNGYSTCNSNKCVRSCYGNASIYQGGCYDFSSDSRNCGSLGAACFAPNNAAAICSSSTCSWQCAPGYTRVGNQCYDLQGVSDLISGERIPRLLSLTPIGFFQLWNGGKRLQDRHFERFPGVFGRKLYLGLQHRL